MPRSASIAAYLADLRDPLRVVHALPDILRARVLAIAWGYEDADDLDALRDDPGFRLALGKLPQSGAGLASQPTMSRWENAPTTRELVRLMSAMVGIYCDSYPVEPKAVTLDIDDTCDVVHGHQQLSFWNGHYGERCFLPIHVYDTATGRPVAMLLRTGKTPTGAEAAGHIRRLVRQIRRHWPTTRITIRGDGHYGRPEVMDWCESNGVDYVLGLPTNAVLRADPVIVTAVDACATKRAIRQFPVCATMPRPGPVRRAGPAVAGSPPGSRPAPWVWTSATSSPRSRRDRPSTSTTPFTALAAVPKT